MFAGDPDIWCLALKAINGSWITEIIGRPLGIWCVYGIFVGTFLAAAGPVYWVGVGTGTNGTRRQNKKRRTDEKGRLDRLYVDHKKTSSAGIAFVGMPFRRALPHTVEAS